jgi:hypothetical protein
MRPGREGREGREGRVGGEGRGREVEVSSVCIWQQQQHHHHHHHHQQYHQQYLIEECRPLQTRCGRGQQQAGVCDERVVNIQKERDGLLVGEERERMPADRLERRGQVKELC